MQQLSLFCLPSPHRTRVMTALLVALCGLAMQPALGQRVPADSARVSYGEEETSTPPMPTVGTSRRQYARFMRLQVEEHTLWKLGLNNFDFRYPQDNSSRELYGLHLVYERKLRQAPWSVLGEISPGLLRYRGGAAADSWKTGFITNAQVAGRYYYNLPRRVRKGKSANNFSANYLSLTLGGSAGTRSTDTPYHHYEVDGTPVRLDGAVLYGLQRRLGRYGFVDFNVGVPFRLFSGRNTPLPYKGVELELGLRIGLALGH